MGKGSRNRQVRVDDKATNPQGYVQKKSAHKHWTSIVTMIIAIVVVVGLLVSAIATGGIVLRVQTAASSENYKVTGTMMSYYAHEVYNKYLQQAQEIYGQYASSGFSWESLLPFKTNERLDKQIKDEKTGETWFDYFMEQARSQVEDILLYCEGAHAAGVKLEDEDYETIDLQIQYIQMYASLYGSSVGSYLSGQYGEGVKEKDVRKAIELQTLANKYITKLSDDYYEAVKKEDVEKFFEDNRNDYLSADYLVFDITATMGTIKTNATDEEKAEVLEKYKADKKAADELAEKLKGMTTQEDFRAAVKAHLEETLKEEYHEEYYDKYLKDAKGETEEEKKAAAEEEVAKKLDEDIEKQLDEMLTEDFAYTVSSDLGKWIFGVEADEKNEVEAKDPAKKDTVWVDTNTKYKTTSSSTTDKDKEEEKKEEDEKSYTVSIYYLVREASPNKDLTYNVTYLALSSANKFTEEQAKAALAAFEKTGKTKDDLLKLGEEEDYLSNSGCTSIEKMRPGYFAMDEVDEWVFNTDRKSGDYALLTAKSGTGTSATTYYIIALIEEPSDEVWYADCTDDWVTAQIEDWLEEAGNTYPISIKDAVLDQVKL